MSQFSMFIIYRFLYVHTIYLFIFFFLNINLDWGLLRIRVLLALFGDWHVCKYFYDDVALFLLFYSAMN